MRLVDIDLLLSEMNNEKTKYTSQIDLKQKASKSVIIDKTLKAYRGLIFDMIKDLPTIEIPQWIPVEERLPEKRGYYSATVADVFGEEYVRPILFDNLGFATSGFQEVLAWMELPQPYQK